MGGGANPVLEILLIIHQFIHLYISIIIDLYKILKGANDQYALRPV